MDHVRKFNWLIVLGIGFGSIPLDLPVAWASPAAPIINTGFEDPFALGPLEGQFGWVRADIGTGNTATVQDDFAKTGEQAVLVSRAANADTRWAMPSEGFPSQRFVVVDWDMRVAQAPNSQGFGPFFGVDSYDANAYDPSTCPTCIFVLGALGVDASTGDVLYQFEDSGVLTETGVVVNFDEWNHFRLVLDFATDTYTGLLNGAVLATTGFVDRSQGLDDFSDADIAAFSAGADAISRNLTSTAVFDNFLVRDGLAGDYDLDGDVDQVDYNQWRATFGTTVGVPGHDADGNANGVVDAADYVVWRDNLGTSLLSPLGPGLASAVVPEPASLALGLLCLPAVLPLFLRRRFATR
jgi:hypothetical protein